MNPLVAPEPITIPIPYVDPKGSAETALDGGASVFLPGDWMKQMATNDVLKWEFESTFGVGRLESFWESQRLTHEKSRGVASKPNFKHQKNRLLIHGDRAEFQDRDSLLTLSFCGLLRDGPTLDTSLLLVSL